MATAVSVQKEELVNLFKALGKDSADEWSNKRLKGMVDQLPTIVKKKPKLAAALEDEQKALLDELTKTVEDGEEIELGDGDPDDDDGDDGDGDDGEKEKPAAKSKGKKKKAKKDGRAENLKPASESGPGVIASIIEFLSESNKNTPLTRDDILKKLRKRFPDRDPDGMRVTVISQLPLRLIKRGLDVQQNKSTGSDTGYWIRNSSKKEKKKD
jgi:hypothetical protein